MSHATMPRSSARRLPPPVVLRAQHRGGFEAAQDAVSAAWRSRLLSSRVRPHVVENVISDGFEHISALYAIQPTFLL